MVDQTSLNGSSTTSEAPQRAVARNTAELMADAITLAELQGRLLAVDIESGIWKVVPLAFTFLGGIVLAASCLPIALAAAALALVEYAAFKPPLAFALSFLGGGLVALALLAAAVWQLRSGLGLLERSHAEWKQNLKWLKGMLKRMGDKPPTPRSVSESRW